MKLKIIALAIFLVVLIISLFGILGTSLFFLIDKKNVYGEDYDVANNFETFRYLFLDTNGDSASRGFVSLNSGEIGEEGYVSYEGHNEGEFHLISSFDSIEYICKGECYCEESGRRGTSIKNYIPLYRTLVYLLASTSSIYAMDKAKTYFEEECKQTLSSEEDGCQFDSIKSSVSSCEEVVNTKQYDPQNNVEIQPQQESPNPETSFMVFHCVGHCVINNEYKRMEIEEMAKDINCDYLRTFGEIEMEVIKEDEDGEGLDVYQKKRGMLVREEYARVRFQEDVLTEYCKHNSMRRFQYHCKNRKKCCEGGPHQNGVDDDKKKMETQSPLYGGGVNNPFQWETIHLCKAHDTGTKINPTVRCVQSTNF